MRALLLLIIVALCVGFDVEFVDASSTGRSNYRRRQRETIPADSRVRPNAKAAAASQQEPKRRRVMGESFLPGRDNPVQPPQRNYPVNFIYWDLIDSFVGMQQSFERKLRFVEDKVTQFGIRLESAEKRVNELDRRINWREPQGSTLTQTVNLSANNEDPKQDVIDLVGADSNLSDSDQAISTDTSKTNDNSQAKSVATWGNYLDRLLDHVEVPSDESSSEKEIAVDEPNDNVLADRITSDKQMSLEELSDRFHEIFSGKRNRKASDAWNRLIDQLIISGSLKKMIDENQTRVLDDLTPRDTYTNNLMRIFPYFNTRGQWACMLHYCRTSGSRIQMKAFSAAVRAISDQEIENIQPLKRFPSHLSGIFDHFINNAHLLSSFNAQRLLNGIVQTDSTSRTVVQVADELEVSRIKADKRLKKLRKNN